MDSQTNSKKQGEGHPIEKIQISNISKILLVSSGKGGVGKSTVAAGLAVSLALEGYSVGLLDADIFGPSVPTLFHLTDDVCPEVEEVDGKHMMIPFERCGIKIMSIGFFFDEKQPVIWRGPMVSNALKQLLTQTSWGKLDYLIIDTPPGTGDVMITLLQQFEVWGAVVVTTPQLVALADVQKTISMLQDKNIGTNVLGVVENMSWFSPTKHPDEKYYLFGKGGGQQLSQVFNIPLLTHIPLNEKLGVNCDEGNINDIFSENNIKEAFDTLIFALTNK
ncbi:MAG: Mrp/NBP35 family ATP-binding protein [Paludibacter sp.]|nr:Mrp/NBP35 family ATP-binding protein [Paludibacter sp.]MDD4197822.1 Mrp/NBP35 family ATP-binding protein [Paludibacter sp.]MDD4427864.1 Mrp/NBP35 family ATP-binding protein [Paludibacter sp.]